MKKIDTYAGQSIYSTGYKGMFAFKAIWKMLKDAGMDVTTKKARYTNTFYIDATNVDETKFFMVRISDHTKRQRNDNEGSYIYYCGRGNDTLECNIIDSEGYKIAKEEIIKFINK